MRQARIGGPRRLGAPILTRPPSAARNPLPRLAATTTLAAALALLFAACDIPRDPHDTLSRVRGDTLRVGVTAAPPWVIDRDGEPDGVEPELVRRFARELGAEVRWSWGSLAEHMEALEHYDLDVAIGGIEHGSPWGSRVGFTEPYHTSHVIIAGPPGAPPLTRDAIDGVPVTVPAGGPIAALVRDAGAVPNVVDSLTHAVGPVSAPDWQLRNLGRDTVGVRLHRSRYVMAVPPGENGFLMALEDALHRADIRALLPAAAGPR
jgi:polar amino acid transport system substrate-binding protein